MEDDFDISKLKPKKKRKNSKSKGNKFQNDVAKILNKRFNTKVFASTPGSGAFATTHTLPEHLQIHGDLITPLKFKFTIECKKGYNEVELYQILQRKGEFWKFVTQSKRDAVAAKKDWLIILKQDYKPILAVFDEKHLGSCGLETLQAGSVVITPLDSILRGWPDRLWYE